MSTRILKNLHHLLILRLHDLWQELAENFVSFVDDKLSDDKFADLRLCLLIREQLFDFGVTRAHLDHLLDVSLQVHLPEPLFALLSHLFGKALKYENLERAAVAKEIFVADPSKFTFLRPLYSRLQDAQADEDLNASLGVV